MKKPWKKDEVNAGAAEPAGTEPTQPAATAAAEEATTPQRSAAYTPKKGRPTPKRNIVEREHGVRRAAYDGSSTRIDSKQKRKELKASMTKEEYKAYKQHQREEAAKARRKANERMMAGDERFLMERDKGKEKRFVRDWVDSHRYLMNLFLPMAFVVVIIMIFGLRNPMLSNLTSIVMLIVFLFLALEGVWLSRRVNKEVNERFPDNPYSKLTLGMYAFTRATMVRRFRTPAPQKNIGDEV